MKRGKLIGITLLLLAQLSCSKEGLPKLYSYLNLRVEGEEDNIVWEDIRGSWFDSIGKVELIANGYYYDGFTMNLKNITDTGVVPNLSIESIYYTDGLDFFPTSVTGGCVRITDRKEKILKGYFQINFNSNNGTVKVIGDFGIIDYK